MNKRPRVLILDHFDSFTYNLAQQFSVAGASVRVVRTDGSVPNKGFTHIVLSPGPGHPAAVRPFTAALDRWASVIPVLGVCLGCQAMGAWVGVPVVPAQQLMHGKTSPISVVGEPTDLFTDVPSTFVGMRYHSLVLDAAAAAKSERLKVIARSDDGAVMAVQLTDFRHVYGVQFHPESFFGEAGDTLARNFLLMQ